MWFLFKNQGCNMYGFGCGLLGFVSLTTLSLMSIEKYIEIKHSIFKSYLTRRKFKIGINLGKWEFLWKPWIFIWFLVNINYGSHWIKWIEIPFFISNLSL